MIEFFVPGTARTAGSKSAFKDKKTGKIHVTHAGKHSKAWMDSVKWFAMKATNRMVLLDEPLVLGLIFLRDRPKGHYGSGRNEGVLKDSSPTFPTSKPDLTKLTRAVEDALTGIVWKDDSRVVKHDTVKLYCGPDEKPGVLIKVLTLHEKENADGKLP